MSWFIPYHLIKSGNVCKYVSTHKLRSLFFGYQISTIQEGISANTNPDRSQNSQWETFLDDPVSTIVPRLGFHPLHDICRLIVINSGWSCKIPTTVKFELVSISVTTGDIGAEHVRVSRFADRAEASIRLASSAESLPRVTGRSRYTLLRSNMLSAGNGLSLVPLVGTRCESIT